MKNALIYTIVFAAIQVVVSMLVQGVWMLVMGKESAMNATGMIITMAVFSVLTMVVFLWAKWSVVSRHWVRTRPWFVLFWCVLAALGALIPSVWIQEHMPELPNIVEGEFDMIMKDRWGYLVVGLLAPLAEEMVFRGAILRSLLGSYKPWLAIFISAIFFCVVHANPAQMPHAFLIGLLMGWMYWRTGSILPGVALHWVNNTIAYVTYRLMPGMEDMTLGQLFGSEGRALMSVAFSFCILLPAIYQLHIRMRRE